MESVPKGAAAPSSISAESIRVIAQSVPGVGELSDEVCMLLAMSADVRIRTVIDTAQAIMRNSRRCRLATRDLNVALQTHGMEPVWGHVGAHGPLAGFQCVADGLFIVKEPRVHLAQVLDEPLPTERWCIPSVRAEWLALEGSGTGNPQERRSSLPTLPKVPDIANGSELEHSDGIYAFGRRVIKSGSEEEFRLLEARVMMLRTDALRAELPHLVRLIHDEVLIGVAERRVQVLSRSMALCHTLLVHPAFGVETYLEHLTPVVLTCVLSSRIEDETELDKQLDMRRASVQVLMRIWAMTSSTFTLRPRIAKTIVVALVGADAHALGVICSALDVLCQIGGKLLFWAVALHGSSLERTLDKRLEQLDRLASQASGDQHSLPEHHHRQRQLVLHAYLALARAYQLARHYTLPCSPHVNVQAPLPQTLHARIIDAFGESALLQVCAFFTSELAF
ncbi:Transcription initiation factor TFIID subunit 6 [Porphyridium purpureum]|uniref:Transcription initiation factor TFIID subunit 6 n=1 Tax=Porphyridium purpureum TaxID=35688 RepID=A0A5J4YUD5_PORPP|nr:Transcription initiation factor TFIID subunit 6 [Porphyridium purpureum]|eukprot:POR1768..scf229_5